MGIANAAALLRSLNHSAFPPPPNDRGCLSGTALFDFETTEWALSPRQQLQAGPPTHPAVVGAAGDFHVAAGGYCSDSAGHAVSSVLFDHPRGRRMPHRPY